MKINRGAKAGQAMQKGIGWSKALRAALADNPFFKRCTSYLNLRYKF